MSRDPSTGAFPKIDVHALGTGTKQVRSLTQSHRSGLVIVTSLLLVALFAPVLAPFDPGEQLDPGTGAGRPPLTRLQVVETLSGDRVERRLAESAEFEGDELVLEQRHRVLRLDAATSTVTGERRYLLGTDRLGRDILSRILYGARISLSIGLIAALLAIALGILAGAVAALGGRLLDSLVMRFVDGLLALPTLLLVMIIAAFFEPSSLVLILIIGCTGWMTLSRLVRAELLSLREREFVVAGRALGLSTPRLFVRHLLPNAISPIVATAGLLVGDAVLLESALSFLGLGVSSELPSWGRMIANGRDDLRTLWWISTFPGLAIALTVLAFALLADGLRDFLDPNRQRRA